MKSKNRAENIKSKKLEALETISGGVTAVTLAQLGAQSAVSSSAILAAMNALKK